MLDCDEHYLIVGEPQYYGSKFALSSDRKVNVTPTCRIFVFDKIKHYLNWDQVRLGLLQLELRS